MVNFAEFKKFFLYNLVGSLIIAAIIAVVTVLFGEFNEITSEWKDGLGSGLMRQAVTDTTKDRKWVVFDGPVDAVWIESKNTVLDDNRTLCLPNGERVKLNGETMRCLFEVEDLQEASPATVSRCGMVWIVCRHQ